MKVTKEILGNNKVKLEIQVDNETFEKGMEKSYLKNRKSIQIPGFRKGRVPRKIIERYYGESIFYEDAINEIFPETYKQAVDESGIEPVDNPELDIVQIGDGKELIYTAEVTVKPEVELGQYKGIEVRKVEYNVSDDEVEHQLEHVREKNARWITVEDRPVKEGDRVTLDYSGSVDGVQFEGGTAEKQILEIGSGRFIPGFEEQLVGMNIGDEKDINVKFPDEYHAEELKGKDAVFKVKIHEIKEKELPELDDEFAKDVSEFSTLDEYKEDMKKKMQDEASESSKAAMENELIGKICENAKVDIPEVMVKQEIDRIVRDVDYRLRYNGMDLKRYLEMVNTSEADFRAQYQDEAYNRVKTQLVLEKISKVENIEANDDDLDKEFARMAEQYKRDIEEIKRNFGDNVEYMKNSIVVQKTIDMLMSSAILTEKQDSADNTDDAAEEHNEE